MKRISDLLALRLANQNLTGPGLDSPEQAVARLGAVQSQDYAAAKWALAQRLRGATDASIEQAFNAGRILRTHVLRPTWHFVLPSEIRWMLKLTAPRVRALMAYNNRRLGLDAALFKRSNAVIVKSLRGGQQLKREELASALEHTGIDTSGLRSSHIIMHAELEGLICSGSRRGKQHTYALLDERILASMEIGREEALERLARLYFTGHGPASLRDFSWWSGLTLTDARRGVEALGSELERAMLEGSEYWLLPPIHASHRSSTMAWLLPNFDEYTVAYTERDAFFDSGNDEGRVPRNSMLSRHTLLWEGRVIGTWRRTLKKESVLVELAPFAPLTSAQSRAVRLAALRDIPWPASGDPMSIQRSYDRWAASYDRDQNLTRDLDASLTRQTLEGMRFDSILEIGCGTGKNTAFLSGIGSRLCALDFSQGMLERARLKIHASNVRFVRSDLTRPWPVQTSAFDLLTCNLVLEHIRDLKPVFAEAFRVMAPGGLFHVSELHPFRQYLGGRAQYLTDTGRAEIAAHIHHISDFVQAAQAAGLRLDSFQEGWHPEDQDKPPRLAVFKFIKP